MAAEFTGQGRKTNDAPNLPEGYVTILAGRLTNEDEASRFDALRDAVDDWFTTDEAIGHFDWTITYIVVEDSFHYIVEIYYHFTDPDTAFRFKMRFG